MRTDDIDRAISDRFARWGRFPRPQGATPILVLGYRHRDGELVVTTVEEMDDRLLRDAPLAAAAALSEGRVDPA
jgi:hypothetical protein